IKVFVLCRCRSDPWQGKAKYRATARVGRCPQPTVMRLDDRAADIKAHSHAFGLRAEKRLEKPGLTLLAQTVSAIGNRYFKVVVAPVDADDHLANFTVGHGVHAVL